jgi:hypothetical protein
LINLLQEHDLAIALNRAGQSQQMPMLERYILTQARLQKYLLRRSPGSAKHSMY